MSDTDDKIVEFDPMATLDEEEKTRFSKLKDDPKFEQMFSDIFLIRKIQNAHTAFKKSKDTPPANENIFDAWFK